MNKDTVWIEKLNEMFESKEYKELMRCIDENKIKLTELFEDEYKKVMEKLDALEEEGNELLSRFDSDEKLHEDDTIFFRDHTSMEDYNYSIRGHNHQLI